MDAVVLFDTNLREELAMDQKLTELGEISANPKGEKDRCLISQLLSTDASIDTVFFYVPALPSSCPELSRIRCRLEAYCASADPPGLAILRRRANVPTNEVRNKSGIRFGEALADAHLARASAR